MLSQCLDRLAPGLQNYPAENYEVIVSDDGQNFSAEAFCYENYQWVCHTRGAQKGPAANRNNGARLAKNDWLIFLDDDCIPDRLLLENYAYFIKHNPSCKVFEGRISAIGEQTAFNEECPVNEYGGNLWSCNFCISKDFFTKLNGFDEEYPFAAMEDIDFKTRIEQIEEIIFCRNAGVLHPWKEIGNPTDKFEKSFISCRIFLDKWPDQNKNFSTVVQIKKCLHHFFFKLIPGIMKFRLKGIGYVFELYAFMMRLAYYQLKKGYLFK